MLAAGVDVVRFNFSHGSAEDHLQRAVHVREAAARILKMVQGLTPDDLVLCLISGGGSALLTLPAEGLTLEDKQAVNKALLKSGATIGEMNAVRKHLSSIKGGRLPGALAPARRVGPVIPGGPRGDPCASTDPLRGKSA